MAKATILEPESEGAAGEKWRKDVPVGLEFGLRNYWYPLALSSEVVADKPWALTAFCEDLAIWRDSAGSPHIFVDSCPHRAVRLSVGHVLGDRLQCAYHGLEFDGSGRCVYIPWEGDDPEKCKVVRAKTYPAADVGGFVWGYIGDVEKFPPPPIEEILPLEMLREDVVRFVRRELYWDINWLLGWDAAFDPMHHPFLHVDGVTVKRLGHQDGIYKMSPRNVPNGVKLVRLDPDSRSETELSLAFTVPGMNTQVVLLNGENPIVKRAWRYPIDENHTQALACWSRLAPTDEERRKWEHLYHTRILPDSKKINWQDKTMVEMQKNVEFERSAERLLASDSGLVRLRHLLRDNFLAQQEGRRLEPSPRCPILYQPWVGGIEEAKTHIDQHFGNGQKASVA